MKLYKVFFLLSIGAATLAIACSNNPTPAAGKSEGQQLDSSLVRQLYNMKCAICHGEDGKLGYAGSKDLTLSTMTKAEIEAIIKFGKTTMPPQQNILTAEQIEALADFTIKLRK